MSKNYKIKEVYYTLQGEGYHAGRAAVFCRFSGCNLWSGREEDRHKAICQFCDTDFWGTDGENGGTYAAQELVAKCLEVWDNESVHPFIVFTGGEPALQLDEDLVKHFNDANFYVAVETNGTLELPSNVDWICCSPKANTKIIIDKINELKLVYPQKGISPKDFETSVADHLYLQPMDNFEQDANIFECMDYCRKHPDWKLSLQLHKILDIK